MTRLSLDWRGAWITAIIAWLWLYHKALIGLHWHDTSEFIGTGRALALAHPPGHPLTSLSIHFSQLAPWFDAAERGHLASTYWGALGGGATYLGLQLLLNVSVSLQSRLVIATLSLAHVSLPMVALQLIRAEVYSAQWALTCVTWSALFYATRTDDARGYLVTGLSLGALAANHTLLTAALILGLLPRLITLKLSLRIWWMSLSAALSALSLYLYIALRGTQGGSVGWGWINSWNTFGEHVSARVWQTQVALRLDEVDLIDNCGRVLVFILGQFTLVIGLLVLLALIMGVVRNLRLNNQAREVRWGSTLTVAMICIALTKLTYPLNEQNPDFSGYLAAGAPCVIFGIALALTSLHQRALMIMAPLLLIGTWSASLERLGSLPPESRGAEAWGRLITSEVPARGVLWSSFYATHFITSALQVTEGWRSDLELRFRGHRDLEWAQRRALINTPHASPASITNSEGRYEPEHTVDQLPKLWPRLSLPGAKGQITSQLITSSSLLQALTTPTSQRLNQLHQRWINLGDARSSSLDLIQPEYLFFCDEDSAYAWAMYYEIAIQGTKARRLRAHSSLRIQALSDALITYEEARALWVKRITEF